MESSLVITKVVEGRRKRKREEEIKKRERERERHISKISGRRFRPYHIGSGHDFIA